MDSPIIKLTETAITALINLLKGTGNEGKHLHLSVKGGGCSGLVYEMSPSSEARGDDVLINIGNLSIVIDPISLEYIKGSSIDYVGDWKGRRFIFDNPNAKRTCGCNKSFGVK